MKTFHCITEKGTKTFFFYEYFKYSSVSNFLKYKIFFRGKISEKLGYSGARAWRGTVKGGLEREAIERPEFVGVRQWDNEWGMGVRS